MLTPIQKLGVAAVSVMAFCPMVSAVDVPQISLRLKILPPIPGRSAEWDWWQARTAFVPGKKPLWLTTMSEAGREGVHNFHDIYQSISRDAGKTWSEPAIIPLPPADPDRQAPGTPGSGKEFLATEGTMRLLAYPIPAGWRGCALRIPGDRPLAAAKIGARQPKS